MADPAGAAGREQALYGAYLSAVAFASAGSGLHHKICHVLGGTFNLPHAQTHATVLPYVLAFNAPAAPDAAARIAAAFGTAGSGQAVRGCGRAGRAAGAPDPPGRPQSPGGLRLHRRRDPRGRRGDPAGRAGSNPRPVTTENLTRLLQAALAGEDPTVLLDL